MSMMIQPGRFALNQLSYTVRVASGKVSSDLTGFPLMIRLQDLPGPFWALVRSDGGNIRAYASDGVTQLPIDVTYINKTRSIGRIFTKINLLSASNNDIVIKVLDPSVTALAVTDTYGRNAVWSDYEVVWVFPQTVNRTGKTYTQVVTGITPFSEWKETGYNSLTGAPHNGISTDGTWFISTDDIVLRRMNPSPPYAVVQTVSDINTALSAMTGLSNFVHMGDPVCVGTSTFFTVTTNDVTYRRFLVEYRTSDLTLLNAWEMTGAQRIFGATVCYDGTHLLIFSFEDDTKFIKYTTTGSYVSDVTLTGRPGEMVDFQGSTVLPSGNILISGGTNGIFEITPAGAYVQTIYNNPHAGIMEGLDYRSGNIYLLKGNGNLITLRNDVQPDFINIHSNFIYANLPTATVWTAGGTVRWETQDLQQAFLTLDDSSGTVNTGYATLTFDEGVGLDKMGIWNSTNSWLYTTTSFTPTRYDVMRMAFGQDGTAGRKLRIRMGATTYSNSAATSAARPSGANMDFIINAAQRNSDSIGFGDYQYLWLRLAYMSDAWLQADMDNMIGPTSFYTVL